MTLISLKDSLSTRVSLLSRLRDLDSQGSWQEFFDTYSQFIYRVALKSGLRESEAEDAVQETVLAVARNIKGFQYDPARCSFKSWLMLITRQRIIWQFRQRLCCDCPTAETGTDACRTPAIERIPDGNAVNLDSVWDEEWQRSVMHAALERVKRRVRPRQFQIFDLYVLQNWAPAEVARVLGISVAGVYLAKHRVGALLNREVKRQQRYADLSPSFSRGAQAAKDNPRPKKQ